MKDFKRMYINLCKEFIANLFSEKCLPGGGIEVDLFWKLAEESGLWIRGTYATAMTDALLETVVLDSVNDNTGKFLYNVFKLK